MIGHEINTYNLLLSLIYLQVCVLTSDWLAFLNLDSQQSRVSSGSKETLLWMALEPSLTRPRDIYCPPTSPVIRSVCGEQLVLPPDGSWTT